MKFVLLIIVALIAIALLSSRISFSTSGSDNSKTRNVPTTVSVDIPNLKHAVTNLAHKIKSIGRSSGGCSDDSDATGDDGSGACGDSGSDDQAGDNARVEP